MFVQTTPAPSQRRLRAGAFMCTLEQGGLRYVSWNGIELVRRVYGTVRDANWRTIAGTVVEQSIKENAESFEVRFRSRHRQGEIDFEWAGRIKGGADGTVTFVFDGQALSRFKRNRIGLCVLHPPSFAGLPCLIRTANEKYQVHRFPTTIEPRQPVPGFAGLHSLLHPIAPDQHIAIAFEGDHFEMEDQRNWIDASFKIYSTPLSAPFPIEVDAGTQIRQSVSISLARSPALPWCAEGLALPFQSPDKGFCRWESTPVAWPSWGIEIADRGRPPHTEQEITRLKLLRLDHARVELPLGAPGWATGFRAAQQDAEAIGVAVELALHCPAHPAAGDLEILKALINQGSRPLARILVYSSGKPATLPQDFAAVRHALKEARSPIAVGTNADFYQLNQFRPNIPEADAIAWSMNPQVHMTDDDTLREAPAVVPDQLASARAYFPRHSPVISSITLKPRFNATATGEQSPPLPSELPSSVDPRQMTPFAAAWFLSIWQNLIQGDAESVTLLECVGWRGLMERETGSPLPNQFPSIPGQLFPIYHVWRELARLRHGKPLKTSVCAPRKIAALAIQYDGGVVLLTANLSAESQSLALEPALVSACDSAMIQLTDWSAAAAWQTDPDYFGQLSPTSLPATGILELPPFGFARVSLLDSPKNQRPPRARVSETSAARS